MILIEKKQTGGSIGKAGRLHTQPIDRSASLQFNPQVREVSNVGNKTMGSSSRANEKLYNGMLPSDQDFIRGLKDSKMEEITEKYKVDGYEGSQENLRDLEEWRSYDANLASKGKHYATRFTKNAGTVKSRKAEASLAIMDGNVLAETSDGEYTIMPYENLLEKSIGEGKKPRPLRVSEAILLRQSDPSFNSFGNLGEFVDNVLMNTYSPEDLNKTMKNVASVAGSSTIPINDEGDQVSVEQLIRKISANGGLAAYRKTNKDQMMSLANYFRESLDPKTDQYLTNLAIDHVYNQLSNGSLKLEEGETVGDIVSDYKSNLINTRFYASITDALKIGKGKGSKGAGPQRKVDMNPMAAAQLSAGSQRVSFDVPVTGGKVEHQEYMGAGIPDGNLMFNSADSYGLDPKEKQDGKGMSLAKNKSLSRLGGEKNFKSIALADGTVIDEELGLGSTMVHPNANFSLTFIPVEENPSGKGGVVPDFKSVSNYHQAIKDLQEMWAAGLINSEKDVERYLIANDMADTNVKIKPVMAFDLIVKSGENVDDRYVSHVEDESIREMFEEATNDEMWDSKVEQTKAFMVVDDPRVYATYNYFGDRFVYKVDTNAASSLTSGLLESLVPLEDVQTKDETESMENGGKAPTSEDIHNILFNN